MPTVRSSPAATDSAIAAEDAAQRSTGEEPHERHRHLERRDDRADAHALRARAIGRRSERRRRREGVEPERNDEQEELRHSGW